MSTPAPSATSLGKETILVVDDEPYIRKLVSLVLTKKGYTVLLAKDGPEALSLCEQHRGPIRVALLDLLMPGMNGLELWQKLLPLRPGLRVLFMSDSTIVQGAFGDHGGLDFLPKPFTAEALTARLRELLPPRR